MTTVTRTPVDIRAVKLAYPIEEVVERAGVRLRRSGAASFLGLCPFHEERNPSFTVRAHRQRFRCFGCGVRGDVLDFVRLHEQLETVTEACAWLEATPRTEHRKVAPLAAVPERRWDRLTLEEQLVMNTAGAVYRDTLWRTPEARGYLRQRGVADWVVRSCGLGYADGHSLEMHLRKHGGLRTAEDLGLLRRSEPGDAGRGLRERFGSRVVVPELRGGQPVWFIGRAPRDGDTHVKYLAMPGERPILGFERAVGRREVFLAEGVFDWLTAVGWGLAAFSPCGTDIPRDRLGWLARARTVFGVFDADRGGRAASERFEATFGSRWQPIALPDGLDLNDLGRRADGRALFFKLVADARRDAADRGAQQVASHADG
jgi:DNA primase